MYIQSSNFFSIKSLSIFNLKNMITIIVLFVLRQSSNTIILIIKLKFEKNCFVFQKKIDDIIAFVVAKINIFYNKNVKNSKFKICKKCEPNFDCQKFKSSKFETSIHETINFIILVIRHSYRISTKYSCAKIQKFVSLNKQNEYIQRNLQSN